MEQQKTEEQSVVGSGSQINIPAVFGVKIDESMIQLHPELSKQNIKIDDIVVLRSVTAFDCEQYNLPLEKVGEWILNSKFEKESSILEADDNMVVIISCKKNGSLLTTTLCQEGAETPSPILVLGTLECAKHSIMKDLVEEPKQQERLVEYEITQEDEDMMGVEVLKQQGLEVGSKLQMPKEHYDRLIQGKENYIASKQTQEDLKPM